MGRPNVPPRPARVEFALSGGHPLAGGRLERLHLGLVVPGTNVLDAARTAARGVHNLHRDRTRRRPDRPHIGHDRRLRPGLVRKSPPADEQTHGSDGCRITGATLMT